MPGPLTALASLAAGRRLWAWASVDAVPGARGAGSVVVVREAQPLLHGTWGLPRPGSSPPALAGGSQSQEAWVPQFGVIFWFTSYGKGKKLL